MKKVYEKPMMSVENFAANEFIAACHDHGTNYLFECNAGNGAHGDIFLDSNSNGELDYKADKNLTDGSLSYFYACDHKHETSENEFPYGFFVQNHGFDTFENWRGQKYPVTKVRIWIDENKKVHATDKLNISEWETAKS